MEEFVESNFSDDDASAIRLFDIPSNIWYMFDASYGNGIECGIGWRDLIVDELNEISMLDSNKNVRIAQVKEKFGTLRMYMDGLTKEMDKVISKAEEKSAHTCELCGSSYAKTLSIDGWLSTLCTDCVSGREGVLGEEGV